MKKYIITAKNYNWIQNHEYILVTFDILAYNMKDAREIGEQRCAQLEMVFVKANINRA